MLVYEKFRYDAKRLRKALGSRFPVFLVGTVLIAAMMALQDFVPSGSAFLLFFVPILVGALLGWLLAHPRRALIGGFVMGLGGYATGSMILSILHGQEFVAQFGIAGWAIAVLLGLFVGLVFGAVMGLWVAGACGLAAYLAENRRGQGTRTP